MDHQIIITDNAEASRFEIHVDGRRVGLADYRLRGDRVVFTHTEILPELRGQGLGERLVTAALDASRDTGLSVVPLCPFVADFIEAHPEYRDLLAR